MAVTLNASTSTGLVQSADTSGEIELQSNGTTALKVNTNEGIQILNCLGVGNATPSTSGAGITFPATQSASTDANTLDDYEEGTYVPTPNTNLTLLSSVSTFQYIKIGKKVTISGLLQVSSVSGSNGVSLSLPFQVSQAPSNGTIAGCSYCMTNNVTIGDAGLATYTFSVATEVQFYKINNNASWGRLTNSDLAAGDEIYITMSYLAVA